MTISFTIGQASALSIVLLFALSTIHSGWMMYKTALGRTWTAMVTISGAIFLIVNLPWASL